jgi:protein phosphatase 1 regulatory subunit 7
MEGLQNLVSLESLWLGKNKIEEIAGINQLNHLRQFDIQSNRLTSLGTDLLNNTSIEEFYVANNAISDLEGKPFPQSITSLMVLCRSTNIWRIACIGSFK